MDVLFCGRKDVSARCLDYLAGKDGVRVTGVLTDSHLADSPTAVRALELGLRVLEHDDVCAMVDQGRLLFDLCISMLYWRILKGCFLEHPRLGAINFHPAPLPQYKGCGGYNLAILEARNDWAVSAHYVDESIDTGALIEVDRFPISAEFETAMSLERTCRDRLYDQFVRVVDQVIASRSILNTKENVGGTYTSRRQMEEMKIIREGDDVGRKARAFWFPPYGGATIEIGGERYTLVDEAILQSLAPDGTTSLFTRNSKSGG